MSWRPTRLDVVNWKMDVVIVRAVWPAVLALAVGQPSSLMPRKAWYFDMWRIEYHKQKRGRWRKMLGLL
jgi:hypothetical protein